MRMSDAFPSKYLKAADLMPDGNIKDQTVSIANVVMEDMGQGDRPEKKPIIFFHGRKKGLVCNKTNGSTIAQAYGDDTDSWIGSMITLTAREVEYQGSMVMAIRVRIPTPSSGTTSGASAPPAPKPAKGPEGPVQQTHTPVDDEDIPF